jgi:hypothetical protein
VVVWDFFCSQCVLKHVLNSTHFVPYALLTLILFEANVKLIGSKEFPIAPHFYPICFGKDCPPFTYTSVAFAYGPSLITFSTDFFSIYLSFHQHKSLKIQYLPHSKSKSYQINFIKSCSSKIFPWTPKAHSNSSEIFSYDLI